jgi:chemotaxis protein methyltransferase CheR
MPRSIPGIENAQTLAQAIVDTIHEPLLVLDVALRVLAASRSFYAIFKVDPDDTLGCLLYDLGDGQWDIPTLRVLLETIIPERTAMDGFEVTHDFLGIGPRTMLLNARKVIYDASDNATILLAFTDVTAQRVIEQEKAELLEHTLELLGQKQILLEEMQHRVANSLQIIASILMLKARAVASEETRAHLKDAHQRVISVAEVQSHLHAVGGVDQIEVGPYLTKLCASLAASMIGEGQPIILEAICDHGQIGSDKAVSIGLIVTELVINAVKYAFPTRRRDARVIVSFSRDAKGWSLSVKDNGVGKTGDATPPAHIKPGGLGTAIVDALVKQLDGHMTLETRNGMSITIRHDEPVSLAATPGPATA